MFIIVFALVGLSPQVNRKYYYYYYYYSRLASSVFKTSARSACKSQPRVEYRAHLNFPLFTARSDERHIRSHTTHFLPVSLAQRL